MAASTQAQYEADLAEVRAALTLARKAVALSSGDKDIRRNYQILVEERSRLESAIKVLDADGGLTFQGLIYGGTG